MRVAPLRTFLAFSLVTAGCDKAQPDQRTDLGVLHLVEHTTVHTPLFPKKAGSWYESGTREFKTRDLLNSRDQVINRDIETATIDPTGRLVVVSKYEAVWMYDAKTGTQLATRTLPFRPTYLRFAPDGSAFACDVWLFRPGLYVVSSSLQEDVTLVDERYSAVYGESAKKWSPGGDSLAYIISGSAPSDSSGPKATSELWVWQRATHVKKRVVTRNFKHEAMHDWVQWSGPDPHLCSQYFESPDPECGPEPKHEPPH